MILHYNMSNQELIELFIASPYFRGWCDGGIKMETALRDFILGNKKSGGLCCVDYGKDEFDFLQITAIKLCKEKQRRMQYETTGDQA